MIEHFPFTNLHDLNLDWIVRKMKEVAESTALTEEQLAALQASVANLESIADYDAPLIGQILDTLSRNGIEIETQPSYVTVGKRGCMYRTINDAVNAAKEYCTKTNRVVIQISAGEYTESINLAPNPGIDLMGMGDVTIIKPTDTVYPNMCLFTAGEGKFTGITFKNNDANAPYCVHYEVQSLENDCRNSTCDFINCTFYNTAGGSGVGCGGGCTDILRFINCEFRATSGTAAYFHNHPMINEQFELHLKDCYFESVSGYAMTIDCYSKGYFVLSATGNGYYPARKTLILNTLAALGATPEVTHYIPLSSYIVPRGCGGNSSRCLDSKPVYLPVAGTMTEEGYNHPVSNIQMDMAGVQLPHGYTVEFNQTYANVKAEGVSGAFSTQMLVGFV